ncbi:MAG: class I SAM-dependent methyltransferase [Chitinispirillaceae bacterium]|nr:class I SAM-dependent methyltransferase [Chitinispirillaceae bacterium]
MADKTLLPRLVTYPSTIDYADGSEKALLQIVSDPSFDEATAWRRAAGWAQYYHLSPLRRNLVSWIGFGGRPLRILELGAGCGAITSGLVAIPSATVTAVEGSLDRAKVIRARCAGAANLEIHACPIDKFVSGEPFDIITLIGVLEYAGRYETGDDPFASMLSRAAGWLGNDGFLLVAIENQLGAKYLSGAPEDHYGIPYEGVNGYPRFNGVRTFTRAALAEKLERAGFSAQWWYFPFPDYKLPSVLFSESAFDNSAFDWSGLVDIPPEPNENAKPTFSDRAFWNLAHENGIVKQFMNSFLVIAGKRRECLFAQNGNLDLLAVKTNVKTRALPFQTATLFTGAADQVKVTKRRLHDRPYGGMESLRHALPPEPETYHPHTKNLFDAITDAVTSCDAGTAARYCRLWEELLLKHVSAAAPASNEAFGGFTRKYFDRPLYEEAFGGNWLPGCFLDLIPLNILIDPSRPVSPETAAIIDLEWQCAFDVPLQLVFDRGYNLMIGKLQRYFLPHRMKLHPDSGLPVDVHDGLNALASFQHCNLLHCRIFETWFQRGVACGSFDEKIDWGAVVPQIENRLARKTMSLSMEQFVETVVQLVEKGNNREAVAFFDRYRRLFTAEPQLKEFEKVVENLRLRLKNER